MVQLLRNYLEVSLDAKNDNHDLQLFSGKQSYLLCGVFLQTHVEMHLVLG